MYGGQDYGLSGECYDEIWAFDPAFENWQEIAVSPPTPPPRRNPALAYNPNTNEMFMFGGRTASTFFNDIWVLDLTPGSENWTQLTPAGTPPCPRTEITGIYDPVNNRLIFFGGDIDNSIRVNETWELDLNTITWSMLNALSVSNSLPMARSAYAAVYDQTQHRITVFSGAASPIMSDVWALDLTYGNETWQQLFPTGPTPQGRGQPFCAYDEMHNALIVGFGFDCPGYIELLSDVWSLNLTTLTWQQVIPAGTVLPRRGSCSSYSPQNGLVYIFGGDAGFALANTYALYTYTEGIEELPLKPVAEFQHLDISPNPVVLPCQIKASLQKPGEICLNIIDNSGRLVRSIIAYKTTAGNHILKWNGMDQNNRRVPPGTYFIMLNIDGVPITEKVVLIE
jgi:outer membrane protein assembly factor BamB